MFQKLNIGILERWNNVIVRKLSPNLLIPSFHLSQYLFNSAYLFNFLNLWDIPPVPIVENCPFAG
jgi:hypothetical protein